MAGKRAELRCAFELGWVQRWCACLSQSVEQHWLSRYLAAPRPTQPDSPLTSTSARTPCASSIALRREASAARSAPACAPAPAVEAAPGAASAAPTTAPATYSAPSSRPVWAGAGASGKGVHVWGWGCGALWEQTAASARPFPRPPHPPAGRTLDGAGGGRLALGVGGAEGLLGGRQQRLRAAQQVAEGEGCFGWRAQRM